VVSLIIAFEKWSQKALSVGRHLVIEGEVAHQVLRFWMVEELGRISYGLRDRFGMDALEVSEGLVSVLHEDLEGFHLNRLD
jgi:hypothetical protein